MEAELWSKKAHMRNTSVLVHEHAHTHTHTQDHHINVNHVLEFKHSVSHKENQARHMEEKIRNTQQSSVCYTVAHLTG